MTHKTPDDKLVIGLPKGSLQDSTLDLFQRAGFSIQLSSRSYFPTCDDDDLSLITFRAQEMARYVEDGVIDLGVTGHDWICENEADVVEVAELVYAKQSLRPVQWVLAVPEESPVRKPEDLEGGIVATELVNVTRRYFQERGINVKVEFSWGATEVKARLLDAIVDVTETGGSIRANKLRVVDTLLTSTTRLIANGRAMASAFKREKIENIALLLKGAIDARGKVGLKMNVSRDRLSDVLSILPSQKSPTISELAEAEWVAVEVIVEERVEREMIPQLKRAGATAIITYPLHKVIP